MKVKKKKAEGVIDVIDIPYININDIYTAIRSISTPISTRDYRQGFEDRLQAAYEILKNRLKETK